MGPNPSVRLLLADEHTIFRAGLRRLLECEPDFRVVGEAGDAPETMKLIQSLEPDVLLLDLAMPGFREPATLHQLGASASSCRTIVLTAAIEDAQLMEALRIGARGVVRKTTSVELLFKGIRTVMAGEYWVGRDLTAELVQSLRSVSQSEQAPKKTFGLTPRELQVIAAVVAGFSNREIAHNLSISENTTKHHLSNIFDKLGVSNRLELALFAVHHRLVEDP